MSALLTYRELAAELGIPHGSVKRWAHEGMPVERMGSAVRVDPDRARAWLASTRKRPLIQRSERVYFARAEGRIKIGWTGDVDRRERELGARIVADVPGSRALELALHGLFAGLRVDGEWFRAEGDLDALVRCLEGKAAA